MSVHYEILMDLLQNGKNDEFIDRAFRYLNHEILSDEEFDRIFHLLVGSLPEDVVAKALEDVKRRTE